MNTKRGGGKPVGGKGKKKKKKKEEEGEGGFAEKEDVLPSATSWLTRRKREKGVGGKKGKKRLL